MCWPSPESRPLRIAPLDASTYQRHAIHGEDRIWPETNCYTDLLIEVAHGFGHAPEAMLGFTLGIDFEGDQWTFFKPRPADLYALYGFDVQELALWKPLLEHVVEQVDRGHPVLVELDSWFLPDTSGSAYRTQHTKTTVGVNEIDLARGRMGYFHNASYYAVDGDDFRQLFQLDGLPHERVHVLGGERLRAQHLDATVANDDLVVGERVLLSELLLHGSGGKGQKIDLSERRVAGPRGR